MTYTKHEKPMAKAICLLQKHAQENPDIFDIITTLTGITLMMLGLLILL